MKLLAWPFVIPSIQPCKYLLQSKTHTVEASPAEVDGSTHS